MTLKERLKQYLSQTPQIPESAVVDPSAVIMGAVTLGESSSIWPLCVLRGDINKIEIGNFTNIQDGTVIHLADDYGVKIGKYVTVGHAAMIHACTIEDECLIGMKATILDGAIIGHNSIIGAGSLVTKNTIIPPGSLVMGTPAKIKRSLSKEEQTHIANWAKKYAVVAQTHRQMRGI